MSSYAEVLEDLEEFGIESCHVRNKDMIAFTAQNWEEDDSLEPRPTAIFFHFPHRKKADQWAVRGWHETTGIHGCVPRQPADRWLFIADPGEVYVLGDGDDDDEKSITRRKPAFFTSVRCIAGGFAYAVGVGREVYRRTAPDKWQRLTVGVHEEARKFGPGRQTVSASPPPRRPAQRFAFVLRAAALSSAALRR